MQCSNKLNTPMTFNPQLRCKLRPLNNIGTKIKNKKFIYRQKQTKQQIKQTNKQTECLSTPPNLNDTLSPMWQEIQYSGMRKSKCAKAKGSPELEHQNTYQKLTAIFSHKHNHQKFNCCQKQNKIKQNNKRKIQKCSAENKKEKIPHLPCSYGYPTNPFRPFFFRI